MSNPYSNIPDYAFWRRAVAACDRQDLDPVVSPKFKIRRDERVSTAGSCFAQHISTRLKIKGFNYFVPEDGLELSPDVRKELNYGVFSSRYGNIYTTRQLLQLLQECYGERVPEEAAWRRPKDGTWVDPLRPQIMPYGYKEERGVAEARASHLMNVRRVFEESDVFIFTLGLTEAWRSKADGTVFPTAPGVAGGTFDSEVHEFVNFSVNDVANDLGEFLSRLKLINPEVKVLLTVSPVPLIATYEATHVLCATTYSKSVLRVAAEMVSQNRSWVDYYPSYEIITGSYTRSTYYEPDYRQVNARGVDHAMRCFEKNYIEGGLFTESELGPNPPDGSDVICDEEAIDQVSR